MEEEKGRREIQGAARREKKKRLGQATAEVVIGHGGGILRNWSNAVFFCVFLLFCALKRH